MKKPVLILGLCCLYLSPVNSQNHTPEEIYKQFKQQKVEEYIEFRNEINKKYSEFMRHRWAWFNSEESIEDREKDVKPMPAPDAPDQNELANRKREILKYNDIIKINNDRENKQPKPICPIKEISQNETYFKFTAYGTDMKVRFKETSKYNLKGAEENDVADMWNYLSDSAFNNLIRDCLTLRIKHNLCDWAYLNTLKELSRQYYGAESNEAVVLQTFLFNQSGYKTRIGRSKSNRLYMMIASNNTIYGKRYFNIQNEMFYPLDSEENGLYIFAKDFPGETSMSLDIRKEQKFDMAISEPHLIKSKTKDSISVDLKFNTNLMNFYLSYPQSHSNNDEMTKWIVYASTPLSNDIKEQLYPVLKEKINGKNEIEAANILIGFVQTAFEYKLDDIVWGQDHPFFPEETLYYPFSDCEDRSALFSTLVRDLLGLETVLLYYPGHLATAIKFNEKVEGETLIIDENEYTYCEPTCNSYVPVGWCPPNLKNSKPTVIKY